MKKIFPQIVTIVLLSFSCENTNDDPYAICTEFDGTDRIMLDLIDEVKAKFSYDKKFLKEFNLEQVYWIQYRDHRLRSLYPKDWNKHYRKNYGKDVFNPCKCMELNRMTLLRIEELQLFIDGGPKEQFDCPSSFNKK